MAQYYLVIKNGGEAAAENQSLVLNNKTPSSVEYGVVENPPVDKDHALSFNNVSNECRYVDSSQELSRTNAAFNSSEEWHYVKGGSTERRNQSRPMKSIKTLRMLLQVFTVIIWMR